MIARFNARQPMADMAPPLRVSLTAITQMLAPQMAWISLMRIVTVFGSTALTVFGSTALAA
jgi:hypothetical protein